MQVIKMTHNMTEEEIERYEEETGFKVFKSAYAAYVYETVSKSYDHTLLVDAARYKELIESGDLDKDKIIDEACKKVQVSEDEYDAFCIYHAIRERLDLEQFRALAKYHWNVMSKYYEAKGKELHEHFPDVHEIPKIKLYDSEKVLVTTIEPSKWGIDIEDAVDILDKAGISEL